MKNYVKNKEEHGFIGTLRHFTRGVPSIKKNKEENEE